jgi:hypothetical protein
MKVKLDIILRNYDIYRGNQSLYNKCTFVIIIRSDSLALNEHFINSHQVLLIYILNEITNKKISLDISLYQINTL